LFVEQQKETVLRICKMGGDASKELTSEELLELERRTHCKLNIRIMFWC